MESCVNLKTFDKVVSDLNRAQPRVAQIRAHFDRFCANAMRLQDDGCPVKGITAKQANGSLALQFLDRQTSIRFRFDRKEGKGVLEIESKWTDEQVDTTE